MANAIRGEIEAVLDGERRTLCLTLGALAELESALGVEDLAGLAGRFESGRLKAGDLIAILTAGLRGGGGDVTAADVAAMRCEGGVAGQVRIVSRLVAAAFADGEAAPEQTSPPPPRRG